MAENPYMNLRRPTRAEMQSPENLLHVLKIKLRLAEARGDEAKAAHWRARIAEVAK